MHVLITSMDAMSASKRFIDSIQLNLISLFQFHNTQDRILSSWSLVGSVYRTTRKTNLSAWFPESKALDAGRAGCFISKGLPRRLNLCSLRQGQGAGIAVVTPKCHDSHERWQGGAQGFLYFKPTSIQAEWSGSVGHHFPSSEGAEHTPKMMDGLKRVGRASRGHPGP